MTTTAFGASRSALAKGRERIGTWWSVVWLSLGVVVACVEEAPGPARDPGPLQVGEVRTLELHTLRFEVASVERVLTREDLLAFPRASRERLWLLDLDLQGGEQGPGLLDNALAQLLEADPASLTPATRNLQRLLQMTPASADVQGTTLEPLEGLSRLVGLSAARVLADLLDMDVDAPFLTSEVVASTLAELFVASHPFAQTRPGPVREGFEEGRYPVAPGSIPITLEDVLTDFASFGERFGPYDGPLGEHPGIVRGEVRSRLVTEDFRLIVRANANALPYRGVELATGRAADVSSLASQIEQLFDTADPEWLRVEGLIPGEAKIERIALRIPDHPAFVRAGSAPLPRPRGSSEGWRLAPWTLQHLILEGAFRRFSRAEAVVEVQREDDGLVLLRAEVQEGWVELWTEGAVGQVPPATYIWDLLLEIAQVRLRDGALQPGEASVDVLLEDVPVGVDSDTLVRLVRENLASDPAALLDLAERILDNSYGDADLYYLPVETPTSPVPAGDYLVFVGPEDLRKDALGEPLRPYAYRSPGFFADADLTRRLSSPLVLEGQRRVEALRVVPGDVLFVEDAEGRRFRLVVEAKPSRRRLALSIERLS